MLGFLPFFGFILIFLCCIKGLKRFKLDWRSSFLLAAVIWGTLIVTSTEVLSLFRCLNFYGVFGFWMIFSILSLLGLFTLFRDRRAIIAISLPLINSNTLSIDKRKVAWTTAICREARQIGWLDSIVLGGVLFVAGSLIVVAGMSQPTTFDSMTTHLSRMMHWIQNQGVMNYPTANIKHLTYPPWSALAMTHLRILNLDDQLANFVQWFAMLGSAIGVSLIAKHLGANLHGQILTCALAVTIPMGILQSSSTQNDYVVAFWLVCFIYYLLLLKTEFQWLYLIVSGASLGLAVLTKGTGYIYALPFLIWFMLSGFREYRWKVFALSIFILFFALAMNSTYYSRNISLNKTIVPPSESEYVLNTKMDLRLLISNIIRNGALHAFNPWVPINSWLEDQVFRVHRFLGIGLNQPEITFEGQSFRLDPKFFHEDYAGNFLHAVAMVASGILFIQYKGGHRRELLNYFLCVGMGFLLFTFCLRWAPWHSRYHLPLFVFSSVFIGIVLSKVLGDKMSSWVGILFLLAAGPWIFYNTARPLFSFKNILNTARVEQFGAVNITFNSSYIPAVQNVQSHNCRNVGLSLQESSLEYPLWVLFLNKHDPWVRIEHINVENNSGRLPYPLGTFDPCLILADHSQEENKIVLGHKVYVKTGQFGFLSVFK